MKPLTLLLVLMAVWVAGCGDDTVGLEADRSPSSYLSEGWNSFSSGDYQNAVLAFNLAHDGDPQNPDPLIGLGWTWAKIGVLDAAYHNLTKAEALGAETADLFACKAIIHRDLEPVNYPAVIDNALATLALDDQYAMSRHKSFNWQDLRVLMAQAYFAMGMYDDANVQVGLLGGTEYPVSDGPSRADLVLEIQRLSEQFAE